MIGWTGKASLKCMTAPPAADGNIPPFNKTGHPLRRAFQSFAEIGPEVHLRKVGRAGIKTLVIRKAFWKASGGALVLQP
jgi:hypothetical protein